MAAGNPPEVVEKLKRSHGRFLQFKEWAARRMEAETRVRGNPTDESVTASTPFPTFQEWLAQQSSQVSLRGFSQ
ncbi:MAG: hypothetical protein ACREHD_30950 [Pirellulales bacterium]